LASGTGIFTRRLCEVLWAHAAESIEYEVLAVEPSRDMRAQAAQAQTAAASSSAELAEAYSFAAPPVAGAADDLPFPDGHLDGVVAAQAFHWFCTDAAVQHIGRKLAPHGVFVFLWNDLAEQPTWQREVYDTLIRPLFRAAGAPHRAEVQWEPIFADSACFSPQVGHVQVPGPASQLTSQDVWERMLSVSVVKNLDPEAQSKLKKEIEGVLARWLREQGRGNEVIEGNRPAETTIFDANYDTNVYWVHKTLRQ
jgi:SAM-dependent methyltransferase